MSSAADTKPIHVLRRRGVKVAIFENRSGDAVFHKVAIQKIFYHDGEWKTGGALGRDDLPIAQLLIGRAWEFILEKEAEPNHE